MSVDKALSVFRVPEDDEKPKKKKKQARERNRSNSLKEEMFETQQVCLLVYGFSTFTVTVSLSFVEIVLQMPTWLRSELNDGEVIPAEHLITALPPSKIPKKSSINA